MFNTDEAVAELREWEIRVANKVRKEKLKDGSTVQSASRLTEEGSCFSKIGIALHDLGHCTRIAGLQ